MAILKLKPSCKDYLWGGTRLRTEFGIEYDKDPLAESWELSCHPDGPSYIVNGESAGKTLQQYIDENGKEILGTDCQSFEQFPVLIKFIDEEGASLFYGFAREVSEEEFEERIRNHTLPEVLNKVMIHKGDVLFIDPGTIHAIGAGSLIAEIQQNSNVTYRVYDYGRKGPDGKERELHVEKALQVTKREPAAKNRDFGPHVASCEYFTVDKVVLDGLRRKKLAGEADGTSFVSVLVMSGAGKVTASGETMEVKKGDSIFITAGSGEYELEGDMEALITTV